MVSPVKILHTLLYYPSHLSHASQTLPTDQQFNLEFQFKSVFHLDFQPEFGIQLGIPITMGLIWEGAVSIILFILPG